MNHHEIAEQNDLQSSRDASHDEVTLLLVEDESVVRMVTKRRLEKLGYVVVEAENGAQALEKLKTRTVDLILSDWMMPVMDGLALCQAVKEDPAWQMIHFILMTALEDSSQMAEGLTRGADDFLQKSASEEVIDARVKAGIRTSRLFRKVEQSNRVILQQQAELDAELQSAGNFVLSLLPPEGTPVPNVEVAWQYRPSSRLGGDLFQVTPWGDEYLGLMILDMSGHGIGPSLRAVSLAMRFRDEYIAPLHPTYDPGEIVARLNRENPLTDQGEYFTIWVGSLHLSTLCLRYTTAGHPGVILTRQDQPIKVLGGKTWPVGFGLEQSYDSQEYQLEPGDKLYLFSDGLYEVVSPTGELWDREGLEQACLAVHGKPMKQSLEWIIQQSQAWQKRAHFHDDVALVGIEMT